jgi:uncharacterized GH25 family protein
MKKLIYLSLLALLFHVPYAQAHSIWINAFESQAHNSPHAMVSLGWGHALPMDDILTSPDGRIVIDSFALFDPDQGKTDLLLPPREVSKAEKSNANFDLFAADLAIQKIAFKESRAPGVYQLAAVSRPAFYTQYIDKAGRTRMQLKPKNELDDIAKILMAVKFQAFAKSYLTLGAWTPPQPLGHGLEIIPRTDLSNLHVGDLVEVEVLFYGKPLTATAKSIEYITAQSSAFGQSDGFSLFSYLMDGKAQFRVQNSGQWMIGVNHKDDVTADGPLKDLLGQAEQVYHAASLTFNVK